MKVLYFTATGNSLYVAKRLDGESLSIPQLIKNNVYSIEDDVVGVVSPVYFGEVPKLVQKYLSQVKITTNYLFFIGTYGLYFGNAFVETNKLLKDCQFNCVEKILMVDNYLPGFDMDSEKQKSPNKKIEEQIDKVLNNISDRKNTVIKEKVIEKLVGSLEKKRAIKELKGDFGKNYMINDKCIACGICSKVCPTGNITIKEKPQFFDKCEQCYSCIQNCPKNAIHLKNEKSSARFLNENVKLKEIIESNSQI